MGQGLYRCVGWGCLKPPQFDWEGDDTQPLLFDVVETRCEAEPDYLMIPFGVDNKFLQKDWNVPPLPAGLPHVHDRTAVAVRRCESWPNAGTKGIWVSNRIVTTWEILRLVAAQRGLTLPEGEPVFVCDWD